MVGCTIRRNGTKASEVRACRGGGRREEERGRRMGRGRGGAVMVAGRMGLRAFKEA